MPAATTLPQRFVRNHYTEFVATLNPSQRNALRALLHNVEFESELASALGMLTENWETERLGNLVEIGFSDGETIKRRLAELAAW